MEHPDLVKKYIILQQQVRDAYVNMKKWLNQQW